MALLSLIVLAAVSVTADGGCLDAKAVTLSLETVLAVASGDRVSELGVDVTAAAAAPGWNAVELTARTREGLVLERRFSLADADCGQSADLLETVLLRFLDGFPRERWTSSGAPAPRPPIAWRRLGIAPRAGMDLGLLPSPEDPLIADTSGDFELAMASDRRGPSGEILLRLGTWSNVGAGRFQPVSLLAGLGWRWVGVARSGGLGARSGVVSIRGDRREEPVSERILPWVEVYADLAWHAGRVRIGPQVALSLLRVSAETRDGADRRVVPANRVGIRLELPL